MLIRQDADSFHENSFPAFLVQADQLLAVTVLYLTYRVNKMNSQNVKNIPSNVCQSHLYVLLICFTENLNRK